MENTIHHQVNVVVVTYNNAITIGMLLDSLVHEAELVRQVVFHDNGSSDETATIVAAWMQTHNSIDLKLVRGENVGFGAGIYAGSQHFLDHSLPTLCLNPDIKLTAGTLRRLLDTLNSDPSAAIVGAPLIDEHGNVDTASVRRLPQISSGLAYSIFGRLLPSKLRYNSVALPDQRSGYGESTRVAYTFIEATTGALMLIRPTFRSSDQPIFDLAYWMYGEDLQLCCDAKSEGYRVAMIDFEPSIHRKGTSSGWPRGKKANAAFHDALAVYYAKNLSHGPIDRAIVTGGIRLRLGLSLLRAKTTSLATLFKGARTS